MPELKNDPVKEKRIEQEVVVDAHDESERMMGWYYYIEDKLNFPFRARCIVKRLISPLKKDEEVQVQGMAPEEECEKEMFVKVTWQGRKLAVPLAQLEGIKVDDETEEAIEDCLYFRQDCRK